MTFSLRCKAFRALGTSRCVSEFLKSCHEYHGQCRATQHFNQQAKWVEERESLEEEKNQHVKKRHRDGKFQKAAPLHGADGGRELFF